MVAAALIVIVGALLVAGCGGSDDDDAAAGSTSAAAPVTTAPATTAPATTAPATTAPTTTAEAPVADGTVAAGKQVFEQTCAGCHAGLGTQTGYGPKLAGKGLSEAAIRTMVTNGGNLMPAGLVEGQELADVVAYVSSLQ